MEKLNTAKHWTGESIRNFTHRIASDFLAQLELKLEEGEISRGEVATRLRRSPGRVSQMFSAANMNLASAVKLARAIDMKVALVAYDDGDRDNDNGPINSAVFSACWASMGRPINFFELRDVTMSTTALANNCDQTAATIGFMTKSIRLDRNAITTPTPVN